MRQKIFYVSRDPAHAEEWLVSAPAMSSVSFISRDEAVAWARRQAQGAGRAPDAIARVLVQDHGNHWSCAFESGAGHDASPLRASRSIQRG